MVLSKCRGKMPAPVALLFGFALAFLPLRLDAAERIYTCLLLSRSRSFGGDLGGQRGRLVRKARTRCRARAHSQQRAHAPSDLGGGKRYCRERRPRGRQRASRRRRHGRDCRQRKHSDLLFCDAAHDQTGRGSQRKNRRQPKPRHDRRFRPAREPEKVRSGSGEGCESALHRRSLRPHRGDAKRHRAVHRGHRSGEAGRRQAGISRFCSI